MLCTFSNFVLSYEIRASFQCEYSSHMCDSDYYNYLTNEFSFLNSIFSKNLGNCSVLALRNSAIKWRFKINHQFYLMYVKNI